MRFYSMLITSLVFTINFLLKPVKMVSMYTNRYPQKNRTKSNASDINFVFLFVFQ
jgi:hypothetical protein